MNLDKVYEEDVKLHDAKQEMYVIHHPSTFLFDLQSRTLSKNDL